MRKAGYSLWLVPGFDSICLRRNKPFGNAGTGNPWQGHLRAAARPKLK
jgi:hypothetical protein